MDIYVDGCLFHNQRDAAEFIGCAPSVISFAIKSKRYAVKKHIVWSVGIDPNKITPVLGNRGRRVLVDGVIYPSLKSAAKSLGSESCALRLALDMKNTFKGKEIGWID